MAFGKDLQGLDMQAVRSAFETLDARCRTLMDAEDVDTEEYRVRHYADVCYIGQGYSLEIPLSLDNTDATTRLYEDFVKTHTRIYGYGARSPARIVNLRAVHQAGGNDSIDSSTYMPVSDTVKRTTRKILVTQSADFVEASVYRRDTLPVGFQFDGPAIVEQSDTTTLVEPGWHAQVDVTGNVVLLAQ